MQAGVSELTMAAVAVGMSLHGGVIPVCGTFFAFSDYMKPVLRMAALMQQPVKFVWTHDAFRVGENGPTHQPIEQEAQLRLLEKVHNHDGKPGLLALRPADSAETTVAWKMAMENTDTPTGLILTRQNVKDLPTKSVSHFEDAKHAEQGAYIVQESVRAPELIVIANGSEVSTALNAAKILPDIMIRIVMLQAKNSVSNQMIISMKYFQKGFHALVSLPACRSISLGWLVTSNVFMALITLAIAHLTRYSMKNLVLRPKLSLKNLKLGFS